MTSALRKRGEVRRVEIVENALILAGLAGPARVTTAEIANATGISHAAVFRHFPTKDDLWDAVGGRIEQEIDALNTGILSSTLNATDAMERLIRSYLCLGRRWPAMYLILQSREVQFQNTRLQARVERIEEKLLGAVRAVIDKGCNRGDFPFDLPVEDVAWGVASFIRGLTVRWAWSPDTHTPNPQMERLWPMLARGLGANNPNPPDGKDSFPPPPRGAL